MLYKKILMEFLIELKLENYSGRTIDSYRHNNNQFINWFVMEFGREPELEEVNRQQFKAFIAYSIDRGRKSTYINAILKGCRCFWNYVLSEELVDQHPMEGLKMLKVEKKMYVTFSKAEIKKLLSVWGYDSFLSARNKTIIALFMDTGIRVSELLQIKDSDMMDSYIKVHGKGNKWRVVPVSDPLKYILSKYVRIRDAHFNDLRMYNGKKRSVDDSLFLTKAGRTMKTVTNVELIVKETGRRAGIPLDRVYPHNLRHYYASTCLLLEQDIHTISKILGHSSIKTTSIYIQSITDEQTLAKAVKTSPLDNL